MHIGNYRRIARTPTDREDRRAEDERIAEVRFPRNVNPEEEVIRRE